MRLTVLGSGTSIPHPKRSSSGFWLETSSGTVLLDCSATGIRRILEEDLDWTNLDSIWISHFHLDHCGGLAPLLAGVKHSDEMKKRTKPLNIFGPPGIKRLIDDFNDVNDYKLLEQPFPLEIIEIESLERFEIVKGVEAVAMSTPHTDESHAIHIRDSDDSTLVYTADSGFTETLASFGGMADLLIIEASYPKNKPKIKHMELAETMFIIRKAKPKRAVLTHLYPVWDDIDFEKEVAKYSPPCEVIEATDGLRLTI
jgi:ribonuclease BN (tRNA processing enzyme)